MSPSFKLNLNQELAVSSTLGRILVLAGAGSGKTKVLTHRIAYLIQKKNISPESILALTFTNKAAQEMKHRVAELIGKSLAKKVTLSTFHSFCLQILRKHISTLGFTKDFSLYDEKDIKRMLKQILEEDSVSKTYEQIVQHSNQTCEIDKDLQSVIQRLKESMKAYNALDFDSLLSLSIELFKQEPTLLNTYQDRYVYIMIDEYQDTNPIQFELAEMLAKKHNNLFVVGDDDQSIYGWRGAQIQNILQFKSDKTIRLEQNYRSSQNILDAANTVIKNNKGRHDKTLFSKIAPSHPIQIFHAPTETEEAKGVIDRILALTKQGYSFKDMAILYRSNILSRNFEVELMHASWKKNDSWVRGIPYDIFGGVGFAERSEIKDLFAYLRLIANSKDEEALLRIINVPRRGISDKSLSILTTYNRSNNISLYSLLQQIEQGKLDIGISSKGKGGIQSFMQCIDEAKEVFQTTSLSKALKWFIEKIDMKKIIEEEVKSEKVRQFKMENISECLEAISSYEKETPKEEASLQHFISTSILAKQNLHGKKKYSQPDAVQLMTFHSAKGLEFPICFLVGLEDHILPHEKSVMTTSLEEERRLFYVALTRCQSQLFLSMARKRKKLGKLIPTNPSRFLFEIPKDLLKMGSHKFFE